MNGTERGEPAVRPSSLRPEQGSEVILIVVPCPRRPIGLRARARTHAAWHPRAGRRRRGHAAHGACRPGRHATTAHDASGLTRGPCRHRLRGGTWPRLRRGRRGNFLGGGGRLPCHRGLLLGCSALCCRSRCLSLPRRRLAGRGLARRRAASSRAPRRLARGRLPRRAPPRRGPSCAFARRGSRRARRLARRSLRARLARATSHASTRRTCAPGGLSLARTSTASSCALLPSRFRSHGFCSSSFDCRPRPSCWTRRSTNHTNWSNLAVPHEESIVFFIIR